LPMALSRDFAWGVHTSPSPTPTLSMCHVDPETFPAVTIPLTPEALQAHLSTCKGWTIYPVACFALALKDANGPVPSVVMVGSGTVPMASGLSSSSALTCASLIVASTVLSLPEPLYTRAAIASRASEAERLIGMEGGGMDQAISMLAQRGYASHVEFNPVRATPIPFFKEECARVCVLNSGTVADKKTTLDQNYNRRVAECRLGCLMISHAHIQKTGADCTVRDLLKSPKDVIPATICKRFNISTGKALDYADNLPVEATLEEIGQTVGIDAEDIYRSLLATSTGGYLSPKDAVFKLKPRLTHVFSEVMRVRAVLMMLRAAEPLEADEQGPYLNRVGEMLLEGNISLGMDYECSCEELDMTVNTAVLSGARGARLTGAGFGGWCVAIVGVDKIPTFLEKMTEYYKSRNMDPVSSFFFTDAGAGAAIIRPDSM
ncbi:galactokinase, partial [Kipferlia bialata]